MKLNTKSSFTLPAEEVKLIESLKKALGAKSNVEVVRQGLQLLKDSVERRRLREAYGHASKVTRASTASAVGEFDHLSDEGLE